MTPRKNPPSQKPKNLGPKPLPAPPAPHGWERVKAEQAIAKRTNARKGK